jgi:hypothetical protein
MGMTGAMKRLFDPNNIPNLWKKAYKIPPNKER